MKKITLKIWLMMMPFLLCTNIVTIAQVPDFAFTTKTKVVHSKYAMVTIHTSAQCDQCKTTIETALHKVKGIKNAILILYSHNAMVTYNPKKIDPDAIRKAITMAGYDADDLKANQEAHDNLPACCRKGGHN